MRLRAQLWTAFAVGVLQSPLVAEATPIQIVEGVFYVGVSADNDVIGRDSRSSRSASPVSEVVTIGADAVTHFPFVSRSSASAGYFEVGVETRASFYCQL